MSTLGITLARGGSKGVPGKNIKLLAGKPLIAYTIEEALKSTLLDHYVVSTDSHHIADVAEKYGAKVIMRPSSLSGDHTPTLPALLHALERMESDLDEKYDIVADIRCPNPFKTVFDIDGAIDKLVRTGADAVIGVCKVEDKHPSRLKHIFRDRLVDIWPEPVSGNRQDLEPEVYVRNGSIYAVRRAGLEEGIHIKLSDNVRAWIMPAERSVNIDTPLDFLLAEALMEKRNDAI
jgi:CMP-N,N'-diacetyllegionaminic acid synthase